MHWLILPYRRYFEFSGRSRRTEYWWFLFFTVLVIIALLLGMFGIAFDSLRSLIEGEGLAATPAFEDFSPGFWVLIALFALFALASFIPSIAVQIRRLHDLNVSGWWYLAYIVAGAVVGEIPQAGDALGSAATLGWYAWMFFPGTKGPNRYGDDPKDPMNLEVFA